MTDTTLLIRAAELVNEFIDMLDGEQFTCECCSAIRSKNWAHTQAITELSAVVRKLDKFSRMDYQRTENPSKENLRE